MQTTADWRELKTAEQIEADLGIKFEGPGLYLSNSDTLLVVPMQANYETVWRQKQPHTKKYDVLVFNCAFRETVLSVIGLAPIRSDTRS